ncbi:MAG: polysaccharide biosynthesis C-terminal domain-containing protein [Thermoplasmata archaeon]|nr:polysaccharide biosynthesis C-terminal domain-containing protein [Thermoplasmata archaeon]
MIARKSFLIILTQGTSAALGILGIMLVSKLWGSSAPSLMGVIWFGMAFVGTFSFIMNLGFDATHVKKMSEGKDQGSCIGTFIAIKLLLVSIMIMCVVGGIAIWKYVLQKDFYDATKESVIYLFLGYYVFFGLAQIPIMTFNSRKEIAKSQFSAIMDTLTRVPLMILVAMAGVTGAFISVGGTDMVINILPTYDWPSSLSNIQIFLSNNAIGAFATTYMLGALIMFITGMIMLRKYPIKKPDMDYAKLYLKFAAPLMIPLIFTLLIANVDKVMLGFFWTSIEVGYYSSVQRFSTLILLFASSIAIVLFPTISSVYSNKKLSKKKKIHEIVKVTKQSERYSSMIIVPIIFFLFTFSQLIIDIFLNSSFRPAEMSLRILVFYTLIYTFLTPYRYLVLGMDKPKILAKTIVISGITNILLNIVLIPSSSPLSNFGIIGASGAACAALVSGIILYLGLRFYSGRMTRKHFNGKNVGKHIIAGIIMSISMMYISSLFDSPRWYHLVIFGFISILLYVSILWAIKEFKKKDFDFFMDTINPLEIFNYVRSEMKRK